MIHSVMEIHKLTEAGEKQKSLTCVPDSAVTVNNNDSIITKSAVYLH